MRLYKLADRLSACVQYTETHNAWHRLYSFANKAGSGVGKSICTKMLNSMYQYQMQSSDWIHKGLGFYLLWENSRTKGDTWIARRNCLLTLVEDVLRSGIGNQLSVQGSGAYRQALQEHDLEAQDIDDFSQNVWNTVGSAPSKEWFSELILADILESSSKWSAFLAGGLVTGTEVGYCNRQLMTNLIASVDTLSTTTQIGKQLEQLSLLLFGATSGVRAYRKKKGTYQIDVYVDLAGNDCYSRVFGQSLIVECKNWKSKADVNILAKLLAATKLANSNTGVILSREGITGKRTLQNATYVAIASYLRLGVTTLILGKEEIEFDAIKHGILHVLLEKANQLRVGSF